MCEFVYRMCPRVLISCRGQQSVGRGDVVIVPLPSVSEFSEHGPVPRGTVLSFMDNQRFQVKRLSCNCNFVVGCYCFAALTAFPVALQAEC